MKSGFKPMKRRVFLKKGIVSGVAVILFPRLKRAALSVTREEALRVPDDPSVEESVERLRNIVRRYGGEFADVYGEFS